MNKVRTLILIFTIAVSFQAIAQKNIMTHLRNYQEIGDELYDNFSYTSALDSYQIAFAENKSDSLKIKIADCYRKLNDPENSAKWYEEVLSTRSDLNSKYSLYYAEALSSVGKYAEAKIWYEKYGAGNKADGRVEEKISSINNQQNLHRNVSKIKVNEVSFNSPYADFSPVYYKGDLCFVSARPTENPLAPTYNWDEKSYLDIYRVNTDSNKVSFFSKEINSRYHEGPFVFNHDGTELIFTRNNYVNGKLKKSKKGVTYLKLFMARYNTEEKVWKEPVELPFNSDDYSVGHPTLSPDGKTLYFASDMPGGKGGTDLYKVERRDSTWSEPVNLGDAINTEGDEMFPYLHKNNHLYFASNGHGGLGGLDVFGVDLKNGSGSKVINPGVPINSSFDDFGIIMEDNEQKGYFSSNRKDSKDNDEIYEFESSVFLLKENSVSGLISDAADDTPVSQAVVQMIQDEKIIAETITDESGKYYFVVNRNKKYVITVAADNYLNNKKELATIETELTKWEVNIPLQKDYSFSLYGVIANSKTDEPIDSVSINLINNFTNENVPVILTNNKGSFEYELSEVELGDRISFQINIEKQGYLGKNLTYNGKLETPGQIDLREFLNVKLEKIDLGADLGKLVDVQPIYFDVGKYAIRPDAAKELDKIVKVMRENPGIEIELGSHTDARGSGRANMSLSEKRARSSANYLIEQGIGSARITYKGYGESELINHCSDGVQCSEAEHQENRRTEFKITKY